jgi:CubicO group peptidase (beta-lactamase class C family)
MARRLAALLALVLVLPAAALAQSSQPSPAEESAVPIPPGQIDAAVGQLDALAQNVMARTGVPGLAIAVVH